MTKANKVPKPSVGAFLNMAREYQSAANTLFPIAKEVTSPTYFLYAHTLELAFKAYLGSHGCSVPQIHDLESLCNSCQKHGLHVNDNLMATVAKDVERTLNKDLNKEVVLKFIVGKPEKKVQL
jgi:HEPN domain-containing protein